MDYTPLRKEVLLLSLVTFAPIEPIAYEEKAPQFGEVVKEKNVQRKKEKDGIAPAT